MKSYAQIHLQLSNLQYDEILLKHCEKCAKKRFASALMGSHHIANWRAGGESAHNSSLFLYTILFNKINIQRLNCLDSFWIYDCSQAIRGWPGFARPVTDTRPSADGLGPRLAPNSPLPSCYDDVGV